MFFPDHIWYTKIGCNKNSLNSLNIMVNYQYHSENRVITSVGRITGFTVYPYHIILYVLSGPQNGLLNFIIIRVKSGPRGFIIQLSVYPG